MFDNFLCPVCDCTTFKDRVEMEAYHLRVRECVCCGLGVQPALEHFVTTTPGLIGLYSRNLYDNRQIHNNRPGALSRFNHDYWVAKQRFAQLEKVLPTSIAKLWVDMGCGNGAFLAYARSIGWNVAGLELDSEYCKEISQLLLIPCYTPYQYFVEGNYDLHVLSLFDVIEHMLDPVGLLSRYGTKAQTIVIETPDHTNVTNFKDWKHYRPNEHLTYWRLDTFQHLVNNKLSHAFKIVHARYPVPDKLQLVLEKK